MLSRSRFGIALATASLLACNRAPKSDQERGASIFLRACASCHGPTGRPPRSIGPVMPRDLSDPRLYEQRTDAELKAVIREGKGVMPAFGALLADEDLELVIAHLHRLAKPR